jgi:tetratricopeptide (TPR) repeat protein
LSSQFSANPPGHQTGPGATGGGQEARAGAPVSSGAVPALADCFTPRPHSGPGSLDSLAPGQWLALTTAPGSPAGTGGLARAAQVRDWPGGTGKTQLAVHLALTWRKESPDGVLVWLAAASRDLALSGYRQATLERSGMIPPEDAETTATRFLAWLAETRQPWLVVLDGVSDPAELDGLWPAGLAGRVLVTAADDLAVAGSRNALVFPVGPFSPHEALTYLTARLSADPDQRLGAVDLVQELSCDPLALAQASATIASSGVNCRDYREIFATRREQIAEASGEQPAAKAVTWTLAMECADELAPGGGAQLCLALAALLGCQGIPEAVFSADAAAEFIAGPGASAADAGRARAALLSLQRTGLLTIDPGSGSGSGSVSTPATGRVVRVHPAVQAGVRSAMPDSMRDRAALAAAAALLQTWPDAEQSPLACSLRACVASLDQAAGDVLWAGKAHQVLLRAGQSLDNARLTRPAVRHWRAVAETSERVLGPAHQDTLLAGSRLASATLAAGDGAEAAALYQRFFDAQAGALGPDHPRVAAARAEFGNALLRMGQPAEAITVLEAALAAGERDRGAVDILAIKDSLAAAYQAAGRYQDATRTALATLVERERSQGPDHRESLATRRNLARAYLAAGKPKDAITYCRRALEGAERALGPDDPDTMDAVSVLASAYHAARRLKDAIPLYEQALSDRERVQGPDDPDTIGARGNLASAYHSAGRMASAVELYERTRADCQRVFGPDHPDTLATRANLAHAYYAMGRISEASKLLESALADCERALAPGDPLTVAVRDSLEAVSDA